MLNGRIIESLGNDRYRTTFQEITGIFKIHCLHFKMKSKDKIEKSIENGKPINVAITTGPYCMKKHELVNCTIHDILTNTENQKAITLKRKRSRHVPLEAEVVSLEAKLLVHI